MVQDTSALVGEEILVTLLLISQPVDVTRASEALQAVPKLVKLVAKLPS